MKTQKPISKITPFTTLDYSEHLSAIVWFSGCNMRCPYCYNPEIVLQNGSIGIDELLAFLEKRKLNLDGVVLSGGECTLYGGILELCNDIKNIGYDIKIDTNGSNPEILKKILENSLVDFVSIDFKANKSKFLKTTKSKFYDNFIKSLNILLNSKIDFEVRTTIHSDFHSIDDINEMIEVLLQNNYNKTYYLQKYLNVENLGNIGDSKHFNTEKFSKVLDIKYRNF